MASYEYTPLPGADYIRLLTLYPAQPTAGPAPLRVSLKTVRLSTRRPPRFEALSYAWGSRDNPVRVEINDKTVPATQSLATALTHLRHPTNPRVLWIDAICTNQSDKAEQSQQVAKMGNVYRLAWRVVAWLGPEADGSSTALTLLEELGSKVEVDAVGLDFKPSKRVGKAERHWGHAWERLPWSDEETATVERLFDRDWFERLWVVQELRLARKKTAVAQCGDRCVRWKVLCDSLICFVYKSLVGRLQAQSLLKLLTIYEVLGARKDLTMRGVLRLLEHHKCQDPRDRVYAVLHIVKEADARLGIVPDYTSPVEQAYLDVVRRHIEHHESIGVIESAGLDGRQIKGPTWVPDWSVASSATLFAPRRTAISAVAHVRFLDHTGRPDKHGQVLRVAGVAGGTVTSTTGKIEFRHDGDGSVGIPAMEEVFRATAPANVLSNSDSASYPSGCTLLEAYCGAMRCGHLTDHSSAQAGAMRATLEAVTTGMRLCLEGQNIPETPPMRGFLFEVPRTASNRVLFRLDSGYIGLGPASTRQGDVACAFLDSEVMTMLRPLAGEPARFQVVGPSFVYGLADDEAVLGPLPDNTRIVMSLGASVNNASKRVCNYDHVDMVTGDVSRRDARVTRLRERLDSMDQGTGKGITPNKGIRAWDRFTARAKKLLASRLYDKSDRFTAEELLAAGVDVRYFDLV